MINEAITLCGGRNVFAQAAVLTPSVALEAVLAARPQLILGGGSDDGEADFLARWRRMPVAALRAIPAHYVAPDGIQRPSPRIIDGIRVICRHVDEARSATQTLIP